MSSNAWPQERPLPSLMDLSLTSPPLSYDGNARVALLPAQPDGDAAAFQHWKIVPPKRVATNFTPSGFGAPAARPAPPPEPMSVSLRAAMNAGKPPGDKPTPPTKSQVSHWKLDGVVGLTPVSTHMLSALPGAPEDATWSASHHIDGVKSFSPGFGQQSLSQPPAAQVLARRSAALGGRTSPASPASVPIPSSTGTVSHMVSARGRKRFSDSVVNWHWPQQEAVAAPEEMYAPRGFTGATPSLDHSDASVTSTQSASADSMVSTTSTLTSESDDTRGAGTRSIGTRYKSSKQRRVASMSEAAERLAAERREGRELEMPIRLAPLHESVPSRMELSPRPRSTELPARPRSTGSVGGDRGNVMSISSLVSMDAGDVAATPGGSGVPSADRSETSSASPRMSRKRVHSPQECERSLDGEQTCDAAEMPPPPIKSSPLQRQYGVGGPVAPPRAPDRVQREEPSSGGDTPPSPAAAVPSKMTIDRLVQ